jgi:hypothetical protein
LSKVLCGTWIWNKCKIQITHGNLLRKVSRLHVDNCWPIVFCKKWYV